MDICADGKECSMTETDEARVADKQHQAYAGDRIYTDERELADIEFVKTQWCQQCSDRKQAVPESLAVVLKEGNVAQVPGFENKTQDWYSVKVISMDSVSREARAPEGRKCRQARLAGNGGSLPRGATPRTTASRLARRELIV